MMDREKKVTHNKDLLPEVRQSAHQTAPRRFNMLLHVEDGTKLMTENSHEMAMCLVLAIVLLLEPA